MTDEFNSILQTLKNGYNPTFEYMQNKQKPFLLSSFEQPNCIGCINNPKNGGSGICNCILEQINRD